MMISSSKWYLLQVLFILDLTRLVRMQSPAPVFHIGNCHEAPYLEAFLAKMAFEAGGLGLLPNMLDVDFSVQISTAPTCGFDESAADLLKMLYGEGQTLGRFNSNGSDVPPAVAIAGCGCSSGTMTLGLLAASSETPVISGQATSPNLAGTSYPNFMRTIPNDGAQTSCQARLIHHMGWKEVTWLFFQGDSFGAFFAISVPEILDAADRHVVHRLPRRTLRCAEDWAGFDVTNVRSYLTDLFPATTLWPRIVAFATSAKLLYLVYLRELHRLGVVSDASVTIHPENFCDLSVYNAVTNELDSYKAVDTSGYFDDPFWLDPASQLYGSICTVPDTASVWLEPNSQFLTWLSMVSREDLDNVGAPSEVGIPDVDEWLASSYRPLIFDSVFVVILAIGDLLRQGTPVSEIQGQKLFDTMLLQEFSGLSGNLSFTPTGERLGRFLVRNLQLLDSGLSVTPSMHTIFTFAQTLSGNESLPTYLQSHFLPGADPVFRNSRPSLEDLLLCGYGLEPKVVIESGVRQEKCEECSVGAYKGEYIGPADMCAWCLPTSFGNETGQSACNYCPQGRFSDWFGRTECERCPAGRAQDLVAQLQCSACMPGTFSAGEGASYCDPCPRGSYAESDAVTACTVCPNGTDTLERNSRYPDDCGCPEGTYKDGSQCMEAPAGRYCPFKSTLDECYCLAGHRNGHDSTRSCVRCEDHLLCPGGHLAEFWMNDDETVKVEQGYMTLPDDPYSVYECVSEEVCEGRRSPFNTTSPGRVCAYGVDILARCGRCEEGRFGSLLGTAEAGCTKCPSSNVPLNALKLMTAFGSSFLAIVYLYARFNRPQPSAFISISLMISVLQSLQTFGQLQLVWPDVMQQAFDFIDIFFTSQGYMSILSLRMECLSGQDYEGQILRDALSPLIVFVHFMIFWPLAKLVRRPLKWIFVHNIIGLVFTRLFIGILRTSLSLFFRVVMPNGKVMVSGVPELEFMSDDWLRIAPIGLLSTLVYTVSMVTYITFLVMSAPKKVVVDKTFMSKARFCFGSVRPDRHWWVLVQLAYAFAVNLSQVCTPTSNIHFKLYMTLFFLILFVIIAFSHKPFKFAENNRVLVMFNVLLVTLLVLATSFIDGSTLSWSEVEYWNNAYAYVLIVLFICGFLWALSHVAYFFLSMCVEEIGMHEGKRGQFGWEFRDCTVAMLLLDDKKLLRKMSELGDYDLHNLKHATRTMITVLLGEQVSKRTLEQRLIPADEYKVWNYHDMQLKASEEIGKGLLQEKVARCYRVRAWVLQMAMSVGEVKITTEKGGEIVEMALSKMVSYKAEETFVDRLVHAWGIGHDRPASRASFHTHVRKSFPQINISDEDIDALFSILDTTSNDSVDKREAVLAINALLPESLLATLSRDDADILEEALEGTYNPEVQVKVNLAKAKAKLRRHTAQLLDGFAAGEEVGEPQDGDGVEDSPLEGVAVVESSDKKLILVEKEAPMVTYEV